MTSINARVLVFRTESTPSRSLYETTDVAGEGVEQLVAGAPNVGDIAGDQRQTQDPRRGGQEAVDDRQGTLVSSR
jgi:hypothetical protein